MSSATFSSTFSSEFEKHKVSILIYAGRQKYPVVINTYMTSDDEKKVYGNWFFQNKEFHPDSIRLFEKYTDYLKGDFFSQMDTDTLICYDVIVIAGFLELVNLFKAQRKGLVRDAIDHVLALS